MDSLKIPSEIIWTISVVTLIVLMVLVIYYKVRKERRQRTKNRSEMELKKDSIMVTDTKESESFEKSVKDHPQPRRYSVYQNSKLKSKLDSNECKSSTENGKTMARFKRFMVQGLIKQDKDVNQRDIHWG